MDVSIIIVNYNTLELTKNCIESIIANTSIVKYEIILVDNASNDGSKEYFESRKDILYIYNNENVGFGRANNIGIRKSSGKYIFLLNSDTYLRNNAIYLFFEYMENTEKNIAVVGTYLKDKALNTNTSEVHFLKIKTILTNSIKAFVPKRKGIACKQNNKNEEKDVEAVIGADMFIRRNVIDECGMFDERIFMYCEEIDLQKRITDSGYKIRLILGPDIVHLEGSSSNRYSAKRNIMFTNGVFYYIKKHNPYWKYIIFRFLFFTLKSPIVFSNRYSLHDRLSIMANNMRMIN